MAKNILIVDYNNDRIVSLRKLIEANFSSNDYVVFELLTNSPPPPGQKYNLDTEKLSQITLRNYSLLIGHMAGNPSGEECLNAFKHHNPKGRAIFYTKRDDIKLEEFNKFKLANKIFRRSDNDAIIFDDPNKMIKDIKEIMTEHGIDYVRNILENKIVVSAGASMLVAIIGLVAALLKIY